MYLLGWRIFPHYRQMHIHGYKDNTNGVKAFDVATKI